MSYPTFHVHPPFPVSARKKEDDGGGGGGGKKEAAAAAMRRLAEMDHRAAADGGKVVAAVAVDGDRGSQHALKWAADHVLSRSHPFFLLHVRRKHASLHSAGGKQFSLLHVQDDVAASSPDQMDHHTKDLLLPFQCFCSRRGLQCRETILDGTDVWKVIIDFVLDQKVDKLVLGASSRNAITRTIWKLDVPTCVTKSAPNFCSVYVISKGKLSSFRLATHANANDTSKEELESNISENRPLIAKSEPAPIIHIEGQNSSSYLLGSETGVKTQMQVLNMRMNIYKNSRHVQPIPTVRDQMQNRVPQERTIQEFKDHSSQDTVHPILRRLPPKFYSPRNDSKHGCASEEAYNLELKCKPLPRPIETKRLLEGLPTRFQCKIYTTEEVANATDHFSPELKVGEGGYGPVYKATLDNTLVAAKILHSNITQGLKQFQQEVELLNNIRHPNMVHLLGACPEYGCLVYEYMPNGSLEDRLFCRSGTPPLPWQLRFKMAVEIATGLLYLHKMKPEAFVHRDLKPENILLDKDFVSKISDVGLARIIPRSMDETVTQYRMTDAAGTFCYIDPEYQKTGLVTTKSDVYALGIIYLQMITAKDAMGLAYMVSDALEEGTFEGLLDPNVTGWPVQEAQKFAELSLKCCELRHRDRPDLESVVLPELIRLHTLVASSGDHSSIDQGHQRSVSDKELALDNDLAEILNDGLVKGASFAA
uniref:Protein kinase domain-containing protein n=1 Tax=Oryza glumipatula TaxID=40148 RepID=A0A0D9YME2_9ORYZ